MTKKLPTPKWQTVTLFFVGVAGIVGEAVLNGITGRPVDYGVIGAFMGMAGLGPILNRSAKKGSDDGGTDDASAP